ncbi:hypothetical protein [Carboxylicivirga marina]|uniref:Uncharacterized protein n=1 Tax=Carboxylicivirga marina TaxID=2800988 RepID=A0ABS1HFH8_9BACT|nr:hypothetical protein [Carboxylicivirga marina]MBK3516361.1 hypothetical protein [Carboxylicivirga marina]
MHYTKNRISEYQSGVELLFKNSMDQELVKSIVDKYGYDEAQLSLMYNLNKELRELLGRLEVAKHQKVLVYDQKNQLFAQLKKDYMRYLKLTRIALADDAGASAALLLEGARARTNNALELQIRAFVSNLLNSKVWLEALGVYNVSVADVKKLQSDLEQLVQRNRVCLEAQGEVRSLTVYKKKLLVKLQAYVSDYVKVVRIAFEEKPKLLVSLGINVKTG